MHVAIAHYHLRGGGVTRVIRNAAALLRDAGVQVTILTGEAPELAWEHRVVVVPSLAYAERGGSTDGEALAANIIAAGSGGGIGMPDIWHFHNANLGKNIALPFAIERLIADGHRILLQLHDFAEDGRPSNYRRLEPALSAAPSGVYPASPHAHYAVINGRDEQALLAGGASRETVHLLPHPAAILDAADLRTEEGCLPELLHAPFVFAPVRGIRRKNVGELGLLSLLDPDNATYVTSLSVRDGESLIGHQRWESFFAAHKLKVALGGAEPDGCTAAATAARNFVTTSVAEGFGLVFLEAALFRKNLSGRDLPEITPLVSEAGLSLDSLYQALWIPRSWLDGLALRDRIRSGLSRTWECYRRAPAEEDFTIAEAVVTDGERVDFAGLDEELQEQVLTRAGKEGVRAILDLNPGLNVKGEPVADPERGVTSLAQFSVENYVARLLAIYQAITASPSGGTVGALDATRILDSFLNARRFRLLLSSADVQ